MRFLAILCLCVGTMSNAQTAVVRGGEHSDFTRLVISATADAEINIDKDARRISVTPRTKRSIDLTEAFNRIPRKRVTDIFENGQVLEIRLGCDCDVTAQRSDALGLILDISGSPSIRRPKSRPVDIQPETRTTQERPQIELPALTQMQSITPQTNTDLSELQATLRNGLLDAGFALPGPRPPKETSNNPTGEPLSAIESHLQLGLKTRPDRAQPERESITKMDQRCIQDQIINPLKWGIGASYSEERAKAIRALSDTKENKLKSELQLARVYLSSGLGLEALALLSTNTGSSAEEVVTVEIARLITDEPSSTSRLRHISGCSGAASLWSTLSAGSSKNLSWADKQEMIVTALDFPTGLRRQIIPRLIRMLENDGEDELIRIVRSLETQNAEAPIAKTSLQDLDRADAETLAGVLATSGPQTDPDLVQLADVIQFETRDTKGAEGLAEARLRVALEGQDYEKAKEILREDFKTETIQMSAFNTYLTYVAENGDTDLFLNEVFSSEIEVADPDLQSRIDGRLAQLGFEQSPSASKETTLDASPSAPASDAEPTPPQDASHNRPLAKAKDLLRSAEETKKHTQSLLRN